MKLNEVKHWTLDANGEPIKGSLNDFCEVFNNPLRIVKKEYVGETLVSTVFLGIDHGWEDSEIPILWETMVFGGFLDQEQSRCGGTRAEALAMHNRMLNRVK
jgi:hypothetical protein